MARKPPPAPPAPASPAPAPSPTPKIVTLSLGAIALGIEAAWEALTQAAADYRKQSVYPYLQARGFQVDLYEASQAERYYVAADSARPNVIYITGCGHGGVDVYTGYFNHPVFAVGGYGPDEVGGKIVHLLSCLTAQQLGPDFITHGCLAYFGYDQEFIVPLGENANLFFECDSEIDRALADGLTAAQAYDRTAALYKQRAAELRAGGTSGGIYAANVLDYNLAHLQCPSTGARWGRVDAKL